MKKQHLIPDLMSDSKESSVARRPPGLLFKATEPDTTLYYCFARQMSSGTHNGFDWPEPFWKDIVFEPAGVIDGFPNSEGGTVQAKLFRVRLLQFIGSYLTIRRAHNEVYGLDKIESYEFFQKFVLVNIGSTYRLYSPYLHSIIHLFRNDHLNNDFYHVIHTRYTEEAFLRGSYDNPLMYILATGVRPVYDKPVDTH